MERIRVTKHHRVHGSGKPPVKRVRANPSPEPKPKIERVRANVQTSTAPARIRSTGDVPKIKNEHGVYVKSDGLHYKLVDCEGEKIEWRCTPTGFLKDGRTATHVSHYGRLFKLMTAEESKRADEVISKKMQECFPNSPYQRNAIPIRRPWMVLDGRGTGKTLSGRRRRQ